MCIHKMCFPCSIFSSNCMLQLAKWKMQNAECRIRNAECTVFGNCVFVAKHWQSEITKIGERGKMFVVSCYLVISDKAGISYCKLQTTNFAHFPIFPIFNGFCYIRWLVPSYQLPLRLMLPSPLPLPLLVTVTQMMVYIISLHICKNCHHILCVHVWWMDLTKHKSSMGNWNIFGHVSTSSLICILYFALWMKFWNVPNLRNVYSATLCKVNVVCGHDSKPCNMLDKLTWIVWCVNGAKVQRCKMQL